MAIEYTYKNNDYRIHINSIQIFPYSKLIGVTGNIINKVTYDMTPFSYNLENSDFIALVQTFGNSNKRIGKHLLDLLYLWLITTNRVDELINEFNPLPENYSRPQLNEVI